MNADEKLKTIQSIAEEIIGEEELKEKLQENKRLKAYDGFEPSGRIHIAQGLLRTITVNKLTSAGVDFTFLVADWFAMMNEKLGGDLENIRVVGEYFIEVWKACGMNMKHVEFVWASDHMNQEYWHLVLQIARKNSVKRITRCAQIMGRSESESLSAAQIFYPCMQAADIFTLGVDIAQLGMDQRKVNVLAREVAEKLGYEKPISIHHHMLMGLTAPAKDTEGMSTADIAIAKKMSKSNPKSAIYMTDTPEEVKNKFKEAHCPQGQEEDNPILEYCRYIIFEREETFVLKRPDKYGGNLTFNSYEELKEAYLQEEFHPLDLKNSAAEYINNYLEPVREHFSSGEAKKLLDKVNKITQA